MKKLLFIFMLVLSLTLFACNAEPTKKEETEEENTQLATPKVSIDEDGLATWGKVKNADGYAYKINDGKVKYTDECEVQLELGDSIVVKAISDEDDYEDSEYSKAKIYGDESTGPSLKLKEYKLGMGVVVDFPENYSKDLYEIDSTVAAVVLDEDGVIVACRIDMMQNKVNIYEEAPKKYETKMELGARYGMAGKVDNDGNGAMLEWDEQVKAFEAYVVGKRAEEVKNIPTQMLENGYVISADTDLLSAGCSIQIVTFQEAVYKACNDEQGMTFKTDKSFTLGVAINSYNERVNSASFDSNGQIQIFSDFAASIVVDGKIIASLNDATQPRIDFDYYGNKDSHFAGTKRELKEAYNMATYGLDSNDDGKVLEWYLQSQAFSFHVVGMTGAEVAAMETATNIHCFQMTTDPNLLAAGCTIEITGMKAIVSESVYNAR